MRARRRNDEQGIATGIIVAAVAVVVVGGTTVAYVATDGFGTGSDDTVETTSTSPGDSSSASESGDVEPSNDPSPSASATPAAGDGETDGPRDGMTGGFPDDDGPRDGMTDGADLPDISQMPGQRPGDGPMSLAPEVALRNGQFVVCTYTHEGYDARVTLRHQNEYHLEQQTQGGLAHVLRAWETTYVWIDGMQQAYEYTSPRFDEIAESQMYPTFAPDDFLGAGAPEGVCTSVEDVDGDVFELPSNLTATPGP